MHAVLKAEDVVHRAHLTRASFIGLLRRANLIVGNSSAGLIEAAAIPARCLDIGRRQAGREKPPNVITCPDWEPAAIERSLEKAMSEPAPSFKHPYGDGSAGRRIADLLASFDPLQHPIIKHSTY